MPYADYENTLANARAYHASHRDKRNAYAREWRAKNRAKHRAQSKAWEQAHPEHVKKRKLAWFHANKEKRKQYSDAYYVNHRKEICTRNEAWRKAHPETNAMMARRRRARIAHAPVNDFTATQWEAMKKHYHYCCVYCGRKMQRLTQDHVIALSKGGSHTLNNIVPACKSCNSKKGARAPLVPVQPLLLI